jgi:hypothetical protein
VLAVGRFEQFEGERVEQLSTTVFKEGFVASK